mgnify:CR=1 FL=1
MNRLLSVLFVALLVESAYPNRSCAVENGSAVPMEFVALKGGWFWMGCPTNPPLPWQIDTTDFRII